MINLCTISRNLLQSHDFTIQLQSNGNQLKPGLHISRKDRKHIFENIYFKLSRYGLYGLYIIVMITSVDFSQQIPAIDMLTVLKSSLKHRAKHVTTI